MATYNRSNLLPYSIGSLLRSTYQDWELIVVGDCCTDDSAEVVARFNDSRIRFINLPRNYGEQSGPNNIGMQQARGRYLAFLNHDDLWFPDHLERSLALLEQADADLVFSQSLTIDPTGPHHLDGALVGQIHAYQPWMIVPATLWVMKKSLAERIGPWRLSPEIRTIPSQDWLHRAHRQQTRLIADPRLGAIIINSGSRTNAYRDRQVLEHQFWYDKLCHDQIFIRDTLTAMHGAYVARKLCSLSTAIKSLVGVIVRKLLLRLYIWPPDIYHWLRFWRKGSFIQKLRKIRGLDN